LADVLAVAQGFVTGRAPALPGGALSGASSQRRSCSSARPSSHKIQQPVLGEGFASEANGGIRPWSMRTRLPMARRVVVGQHRTFAAQVLVDIRAIAGPVLCAGSAYQQRWAFTADRLRLA
jgi:hypothetical protein